MTVNHHKSTGDRTRIERIEQIQADIHAKNPLRSAQSAQSAFYSSSHHLIIALILLLAFFLRVFRLDHQELRGDEAFGYFFSLRTFDDIVQATLDLREPHPVASYYVQHVWLEWVGHSEFALRYLGVLFSVVAVALGYRLALRLGMGRNVALIGAALMAVSPYAVWHSQDARMYSMSLCLTLASSWLMVESLQRGRRRLWIAYLLVTWGALFTHYFALFVVAAQNVFVLGRALLTRRMGIPVTQWIQYQIVLVFFALPWFLTAQQTLTGYGGNGSSPTFLDMARRTLGAFTVGESLPVEWRLLFGGTGATLVALAVWSLWRRGANQQRTLGLLLLLWLAPVLTTWISAQSRPIFDERYLIAASPAFYLLVAAGIGALHWRWRILPAALGLLLAVGMILSLGNHYFDPAYSKTRGWRELATAFERFSAGLPDDSVRLAQNFPDPTIWYYYDGPVAHIVLPPQPNDADGAAAAVDELVAEDVQRVILPVQAADWWDGSAIAPAALAADYVLAAETQIGVWPVQIYSRPPAQLAPLDVTFANGLAVRDAAVAPDRVLDGGVLTIHLRWSGQTETLTGSEKIFLHLIDASGQIAAQTDQPLTIPPVDDPVTSYGILLPEALAAGPYFLVFGLYDPGQEGAPRILTEDGRDRVELLRRVGS